MKKTHAWHHTPFGQAALWLGSVQLAVPVLALVTVAMIWGTYVDSMHGARAASAAVYGSWWFIALMALVCVSLVFAVVTRFPWQRRHVGFITVHGSLIAMIIGGFWSLFGRIEGRLGLEEGTASAAIEMDEERLELVEHAGGSFAVLEAVSWPSPGDTVVLGGRRLRVVDQWQNIREEAFVADDGPEPLRAVELTFDPAARRGTWVGEDSRSGGPTPLQGVRISVLAPGETWESPPAQPVETDYAFLVDGRRYPLVEEPGAEAFPGWTVVSVRRYRHAVVSAGGLAESDPGRDNPAVDVTLTDGKGSTERHTAFLNFPDMIMGRPVEGAARSGARLAPAAAGAGGERLVIHGQPPGLRVTHVAADGTVSELSHDGDFPWSFDVGQRRATILRQFTRARAATRWVQAPTASERRPALLVRPADDPDAEPWVIPWKGVSPASTADARTAVLRYAPRTVTLPFTVRLDDFRKLDYPGTTMAMAYESDVTVFIEGEPNQTSRIHMNNPFAHSGWKVYQSGFVGDTVSIFSVMRDPGLPLTYLGATGLCIGIVLTFYSRAFSWGHPGIPAPFARKEVSNAPPAVHVPARPAPGASGGGRAPGALAEPAGVPSGAGIGAGDAPGHLRPADRR